MTRIVLHALQAPQAVPKSTSPGEALYVCRCGLSASPMGLCDGSHKATLDEQPGLTYLYERKDGKLVRAVQTPTNPRPQPQPHSTSSTPSEAPIQE